jgi:pimeloyl-ACP methyl ester carboxylesterase
MSSPALAQDTHPSFSVTVTGRGPAVVLIPGLLSSDEVWASTVERYHGRYTLHTVTLAGFGGPPPVGSPFLPRVRDELIAYVKSQGLEKPVIVGHSLARILRDRHVLEALEDPVRAAEGAADGAARGDPRLDARSRLRPGPASPPASSWRRSELGTAPFSSFGGIRGLSPTHHKMRA